MEEVADFLSHYGVKGMQWGKRMSRREVKALNKEGQRNHDQARLDNVLKTSQKLGEDVLVSTMLHGDFAKTIMTGKQFVDHAVSGGVLNARTTDIFATKNKDGQYELKDNSNSDYQKIKR